MPWQLEKLQQAAAVGRRKVKVKQQHRPESAEGHAADIAYLLMWTLPYIHITTLTGERLSKRVAATQS